MKHLVASICFLICFVQSNLAFTRPPGSKCKDHEPVDLDQNWLFKFASSGISVPMGSSSRHKKHSSLTSKPNFEDDLSLKNKMCVRATFKMGNLSVPGMTIFKYNRFNEFKFYVRSVDDEPQKPHVSFFGDFVIAKTDNSTYILVVGCLLDKHKFWKVFTPKGMVLPDQTRSKILKFLKTKSLRTKSDRLGNSENAILFENVSVANCSSKQIGDRAVGDAKEGEEVVEGAAPPVPPVTKLNLLQILLAVLGNILTL